MKDSITRFPRRSRPALEGLEGRWLLDATATDPSATGASSAAVSANATGGVFTDRLIAYTTSEGSHVQITIYGAGSLAGSSLEPDGALNLVFSGTNVETGIVARVTGGTGLALLQSIADADVPIQDLGGVGGSPLNVMNLKNFDLVDGGRINLTAGVHSIFLDAVGSNTQVNIRALPAPTPPSTGSSTESGGNGVVLQFLTEPNGSQSLSSSSGQFIPGTNQVVVKASPLGAVPPGPPPAPPGLIAVINHIRGGRTSSSLGDPEIFGYDPVANALIRFDAKTGDALQSIPITGMANPINGVALGRNDGHLVVLVGDGTTIQAFDAITGNPVGQFSTTNLASGGLTAIDGIGSTDTSTVVADSTAGSGGLALLIDLTASLASGQAVPVGSPFAPQRQFSLSGGLTGVPGSKTLYATGAAHFDSFQPNAVQFGILDINTAGGQLSESSRAPVLSAGNYQDVAPNQPQQAFGSIDQELALITGVSNGQNVVSLLSKQNFSSQGTTTLDDPNLLSDISESFRPDLVDSALIDIQGDVQSIRAHDATGMVLNDAGNLNLLKISSAANSLIIGDPFSHAQIPQRSNVTILTSSRTVGDRNGVTIVPGLKEIGPLSLP